MATAKKSKAKTAAKKPAAKNVAAKKHAAKKAAQPKKAAKKPMAPAKKKTAAQRSASKKIQKKPAPAKKAAAKKPAAKAKPPKPAPKKPAAKVSAKPAAKKSSAKKTAAKAKASKPAVKKSVAKVQAKPAAKKIAAKSAAKKPEPKKPAKPAAKKTEEKAPAKKAEARKPAPKKAEAKKSAEAQKHTISVAEAIAEILKHKKPKKAEAPKEAEKPAEVAAARQRACAGIYFSMADLENYLSTRDTVKFDENSETAGGASSKKKALKTAAAPAAQVPKRALAAASISDILGFNPIEQSRTNFEEKDVPSKWKKYYKLLVEMKSRIQSGSSDKVESVSSSNIQLSHENSTQGMDAADIGSKNFERDMAFNLLSNEQTIISEVNAAIERIRNGTYGICEITGKPIPESRLLAVPFTRCTIEGQKQKEAEMRRIKAGQRKQQYGVDLDSDNPDADISDDVSE